MIEFVDAFGGRGYHCYVSIDGKPIDRNPVSYPYSYDPYVIWMGCFSDDNQAVYSDRLYQWDRDKYDKCCQEVFGDTGHVFSNRSPQKINEFLNKYFEKTVMLTAITQGCNVSNGYPYWVFYYEEV